jgi:hypothetical protein
VGGGLSVRLGIPELLARERIAPVALACDLRRRAISIIEGAPHATCS